MAKLAAHELHVLLSAGDPQGLWGFRREGMPFMIRRKPVDYGTQFELPLWLITGSDRFASRRRIRWGWTEVGTRSSSALTPFTGTAIGVAPKRDATRGFSVATHQVVPEAPSVFAVASPS